MNKFILVACALLFLTGTAVAQETPSAVPYGYNACRAKGIEACQIRPTSISYVVETPSLITNVESINSSVNAAPYTEDARFGVGLPGQWDGSNSTNNCKDYTITKKGKFETILGIPSGAVRPAVVQTAEGSWHSVLLLETDLHHADNAYVLDTPLSTGPRTGHENDLRTVAQAKAAGYDFIDVTNKDGEWQVQHPERVIVLQMETDGR